MERSLMIWPEDNGKRGGSVIVSQSTQTTSIYYTSDDWIPNPDNDMIYPDNDMIYFVHTGSHVPN